MRAGRVAFGQLTATLTESLVNAREQGRTGLQIDWRNEDGILVRKEATPQVRVESVALSYDECVLAVLRRCYS